MKGSKTIVFHLHNIFVFIIVWLIQLFKNVQHGYCGKNGKVSDYTERTLCEIDSSMYVYV